MLSIVACEINIVTVVEIKPESVSALKFYIPMFRGTVVIVEFNAVARCVPVEICTVGHLAVIVLGDFAFVVVVELHEGVRIGVAAACVPHTYQPFVAPPYVGIARCQKKRKYRNSQHCKPWEKCFCDFHYLKICSYCKCKQFFHNFARRPGVYQRMVGAS